MILKGLTCILKPLEVSDAKKLSKYINDEQLKEYLSNVFPFNTFMEEELIRRVSQKSNEVYFAIEVNNNVVGTTVLYEIDFISRKSEFGVAIYNKEYWNKGIGSEVLKLMLKYGFEVLGLNRIMLRAFEENKRMIAVAEKFGFVFEGRERQGRIFKGKNSDIIIMSLLADEYWRNFS